MVSCYTCALEGKLGEWLAQGHRTREWQSQAGTQARCLGLHNRLHGLHQWRPWSRAAHGPHGQVSLMPGSQSFHEPSTTSPHRGRELLRPRGGATLTLEQKPAPPSPLPARGGFC